VIAGDQVQPIEQRGEPRHQRYRAGIAIEERLFGQHFAQAQQHIGSRPPSQMMAGRQRSGLEVDRDRRVAARRGYRR